MNHHLTYSLIILSALSMTACVADGPSNLGRDGLPRGPKLNIHGNEYPNPRPTPRYTFATIPTPHIRMAAKSFTLPNGKKHWYEVVYLPQGGINWLQAKWLAEEAGGYLASVHSKEENQFIFNLIKDKKFWFQWDSSHNYVMSGPFIGGFQPYGSPEPAGGWRWVSGEPWNFTRWAYNNMPGDRDPRPNDQPNDATGNQNVTAYGEVNIPVSTWGDFPYKFGSYQSRFPGKSHGFVIEYNKKP
ncbi:hypothetical protein ACQZV8_05390 [Magnetococcales bacterium HHB-1]